MYRIDITKKVKKFIAKRDKSIQIKIISAFEILSQDPYNNTLDTKPLKGKNKNQYRLRINNYRFIYKIEDDILTLFILDGNNRGHIY